MSRSVGPVVMLLASSRNGFKTKYKSYKYFFRIIPKKKQMMSEETSLCKNLGDKMCPERKKYEINKTSYMKTEQD